MSNYFTRLAARTGLGAPKAAGGRAGDIAEQNVEIEAAHPAPVIARSAAPRESVAAPARAAPVVHKTAGEAAIHNEYPAATRSTTVPGIDGEPPARRQPEARAASLHAPEDPPLFDRAAASFAAEEATRGNVADATAAPRGAEPAPARHEENAARIAPQISATPRETIDAPRPSRARAQANSLRSAPPAEKFFEPADAPHAAGKEGSVAPGGAPENSAPPARGQSTPPPAANDVAVHIGAIKVEIHPPARAAPPPAPQSENIPERPRFEPRRHYLRW
jgi:hypothetical protein